MQFMIRTTTASDFEQIWEIINDGAQAYRGIIPAAFSCDPYMSREELQHELTAGVHFVIFERDGQGVGIMGAQDVRDVILIRHAYVRTAHRNAGIGSAILRHLLAPAAKPVLIGTWRGASWAIHFYRRHGFEILEHAVAQELLSRYWTVPPAQSEASVVLSNKNAHQLTSLNT